MKTFYPLLKNKTKMVDYLLENSSNFRIKGGRIISILLIILLINDIKPSLLLDILYPFLLFIKRRW